MVDGRVGGDVKRVLGLVGLLGSVVVGLCFNCVTGACDCVGFGAFVVVVVGDGGGGCVVGIAVVFGIMVVGTSSITKNVLNS